MKYHGFISYSHAADVKLAPKLESALKKLVRPWYKIKARNIYRDQTNLAVSPHLWANIERALSGSENFILMASKEAATSKWVNREVEYWLKHKSLEDLIIVLTDGEIIWDDARNKFNSEKTSALPKALMGAFTMEPLYVDLRAVKAENDLSLNNPKFKNAVAPVAAKLHDKTVDDLIGEDMRQHKKSIRLAWSAVVLLFALTIASSVAGYLAVQRQKTARSGELAAYASLALTNDPNLSFRLAEAAVNMAPTFHARKALWDAYNLPLQSTLSGHTNDINSVIYSPDGSNIVTTSSDNTARVWRAATGEELFVLSGHKLRVVSAEFSRNGNRIVTTSAYGTVHVWDARNGKSLEELGDIGIHGLVISATFFENGRIGTISQDGSIIEWDGTEQKKELSLSPGIAKATFSPNGSYITAAKQQASIAGLWNSSNGKLLKILEGHDGAITSISFSPNGDRIVTASTDGTARVWEIEGNKAPLVLRGHRGAVNHADFSSNGFVIITGSEDGTVRFWNTRNGHSTREQVSISGPISYVALSPKNDTFVTVSQNAMQAHIWRTDSHQELTEFAGHESNFPVTQTEFSSDGKRILTASIDGTARIWDSMNGTNVTSILMPNEEGIESTAFLHSDNRYILTATESGKVFVWDVETETLHRFFPLPQSMHTTAAFSPDGSIVITWSRFTPPRIWDSMTGIILTTFHNTVERISFVSFSPDSRYVATVSIDGIIQIWDVKNGNEICTLTEDKSVVSVLKFSADGHRLVTAAIGNPLATVWDVFDCRRIAILEGHKGMITSAAFSFDGKSIITGSDDGTVRIFEYGKADPIILAAHEGKVLTVEYSPDGKRIVTGSNDGTARLWEIENGQTLAVLKGHGKAVSSAKFSPDGAYILTAGFGKMLLWPGHYKQILETINNQKMRLVRELTIVEKINYGLNTDNNQWF